MSREPWDLLLTGARLATLDGTEGYGIVEEGAIACSGERIAFVGPAAGLPADHVGIARQTIDIGGAWVTPALVDCHTHLVFAGNRAHEFELRQQGASYEQIARAGGGILSTVRQTRAASEGELFHQSLPRAAALVADGVATLEVKSGYGLDFETEAKMLRVARRIGRELGVEVRTTFLGAHALPPEFAGRPDDYLRACGDWLEALHADGLVDAIDAFCEGIGFSPAQLRPLLERAMAAAGTVAVLLPGAFHVLRETRVPPIEALRAQGVRMAVATDLNPGTSPLQSLRLAMSLACTHFHLTPAEALRGATVNAARALGLDDRGVLAVGQRADLAIWNLDELAELAYWLGGNPLRALLVAGQERKSPAGAGLRG